MEHAAYSAIRGSGRSRGIRSAFVVFFMAAFVLAGAQSAFGATLAVPGSYATIQAAIAAAVPNDTISIAAGTYTEVGQLLITKNLSFVGANKSTTIIKPSAGTGASGDSKGWWVVSQGVTFNLSGVTLDGTGKSIFQGIRHKGIGAIQNVRFTGITYNASGPDYAGFAIYAFGMCGAVDVSDSVFDNIGREGIAYWGPGTTGTYARNTYTGKGLGNWLDYGVEVNNGAVATITDSTFTNNRGTATLDGSDSAGIAVLTVSGPGTAATITGSTFTGNSLGVGVGANAADTSVVDAHGNTISGNYMSGVENNSTVVFDATGNYWGANSGPYHATTNPSGTGNAVSNNVTYVPFLSAPFSPGTNVSVPFAAGSVVRFSNVTGGGTVSGGAVSPENPSPSGFTLTDGSYFDLSTTASFSGYVYITLPYNPANVPAGKESALRMFHWKNGVLDDITVSVDTVGHTVTGRTTSFSDFGLGFPNDSVSTPASSTWSLALLFFAAVAVLLVWRGYGGSRKAA